LPNQACETPGTPVVCRVALLIGWRQARRQQDRVERQAEIHVRCVIDQLGE